MAEHASKHKSRYVPALDGLRCFAVLAVIFYHMGLGWAPGGLMGVTVFFVISGYLINGLLVAEQRTTGTINLASFWMRRVRRLFPAIVLAVVGTAALCTVFNHTLLDKMRPDILPSLLFYNNWWQIFRDLSYFEQAGSPSPLTHFWSLSIEEQFYVVWPLVLLGMHRAGLKKRTMAGIAIALAAASGVEMALLYDPLGDPSRIYYGTDTRAMSLLAGVWLAFVWPSAAFGQEAQVGKRNMATWVGFNLGGFAAMAGLVAIVGLTNGFSAFPYLGGIALATVLSAVVIAVLVVPGAWLARLFALKPLVWIGKRSYGMYLWHFPILLLTTDPNSTLDVPVWMRLVQLALIFGISALSYTFVEDPIRKGKLPKLVRRLHTRRGASRIPGARTLVPAGVGTVLLATALMGIFLVPPTDYAQTYAGNTANAPTHEEKAESPDDDGQASSDDGQDATGTPSDGNENGADEKQASSEAASEADDSAASDTTTASDDSATSADVQQDYDELFGTPHVGESGAPIYEPLLIGDSVSAGAVDEFYRVFPNGHIDSQVSRNIWESPYPSYLEAGQVGEYVVFCLGTNNAVESWQIDDEMLGPVADDKKVILVNTRNTREWCAGTNAEIARAPERNPNVVAVVDWFGASEGHDEYFAGDGTHLTEEGAHAYIALIQDAIKASLAKE